MNKPFVLNSHSRIVFPFNFFPELDFTVFDTPEQFSAVIKRDFEEKAPTEADIVARLREGKYAGRYELLRDLALDLFWVNHYACTMYEKRPMRWGDVPRHREDVFLPVYRHWDVAGLAEAIRQLQEVERPVLLVCGEKFSDKIGTVRTSRMIFGDGAAAVVLGPATAGQGPDIEVYQSYASGP
jgi:hypothetical protein